MNNTMTIRDATYYYNVCGEGEPLVLLHGFTGTSNTWETFSKKWSRKFKVITIDLPGHGKTKVKSPRTMEHFCKDIKLLFDQLSINKTHLLGYSMGGRTALSFALYYPEYVHSLILESASPGLKTEEERRKRREADALLAEQIMVNGVESFTYYWENIPLFATQKNLSNQMKESIRNERLAQLPEGLAESLLFMGTGTQPSWWDKLEEVTIPVLLIAGALDEKYVKINQEMETLLPLSEMIIVEKSGHTVHVEQVEKFDKIVMEFISKALLNSRL
ncbi:2-succinyl-6-hydroxy-2,4-cyclohexadiene-1-carboxylate synthase [Pseudogracilibacillus sp. SO30301A]|uniref:2-succinyl-6-hydroxy-2, 4-cyclohexadiene-1-carboxylate synthase n=1 Tax=Pseudogracilibacillus sp. SO30301A TaxID=3098291 RepID=UPI00300E5DA2